VDAYACLELLLCYLLFIHTEFYLTQVLNSVTFLTGSQARYNDWVLKKQIRGSLPHLWGASFLIFGTSWLAAPALNHALSGRMTLISQYEFPSQPYSWLFRAGDCIAALLLIFVSLWIKRRAPQNAPNAVVYPLAALGFMLLLDPIFTVSCHFARGECIEQVTFTFILHAAETTISALLLLYLSLHDAWTRRSLPSTLFVGFQAAYGVLFLSQLASRFHISTLSQTIYQAISIIWIAWFVGDVLSRTLVTATYQPRSLALFVRRSLAVWSYLNGMLALLLSLLHIHILGVIRDIYFAGNTAWLAQHGVIVGVAMLYISRHLARGEHRAREVLLVLLFLEAIKYAVVTPHLGLLLFYWLSFVVVFALRSFFTRGSIAPTWHLRFQEICFVLSGVLAAVGIIGVLVSRSDERQEIVSFTLKHFNGLVIHLGDAPHALLRSSLLAHTITVLLVTVAGFLLWSLFRPARQVVPRVTPADRNQVKALLEQHAQSSEDFFKVWPEDKLYFWNKKKTAAIAYKISGTVAYALADPIAKTKNAKVSILHEFVEHWHRRGLITCFLLANEDTIQIYKDEGLATLQIGSSAVIDVDAFATETYKSKWWRWQRNRGAKAGYLYYHSAPPHDRALLNQCAQVSRAWLKRPGHSERGFALGTYSDAYMQQCSLHYITDEDGRVIAFANEVPLYGATKQATIDLMRFKPDANNAMPFLLANTIVSLADENKIKSFDLGFVPLANMENAVIAIARTLMSHQIAAAGLEQFKGKFKPSWRKNYIAYDGDLADLATITLGIEDVMQPD
jgi:lysylphosphatidylglycerol synthetase-like protein (DUF2156 family)